MKTTSGQFDLFVKECKKWAKKFELNGWEIIYYHQRWDNNSNAWYEANLKGRRLEVCLNTEWNQNKIKNWEIKTAAKHEMIHCLLAVVDCLGSQRFCGKDEHYSAIEELVYKLSKIIK